MVKTIGKNVNSNDTSNVTGFISVGSLTAVKLLDALLPNDPPNIHIVVTNDSNFDVWIRYYPAAVDNIKQGFLIYANTTETLLDNSECYTGEISAIADIATATLHVTRI